EQEMRDAEFCYEMTSPTLLEMIGDREPSVETVNLRKEILEKMKNGYVKLEAMLKAENPE
ncbi:unnamed protein product, partial [marine sediment metagenome]